MTASTSLLFFLAFALVLVFVFIFFTDRVSTGNRSITDIYTMPHSAYIIFSANMDDTFSPHLHTGL